VITQVSTRQGGIDYRVYYDVEKISRALMFVMGHEWHDTENVALYKSA